MSLKYSGRFVGGVTVTYGRGLVVGCIPPDPVHEGGVGTKGTPIGYSVVWYR